MAVEPVEVAVEVAEVAAVQVAVVLLVLLEGDRPRVTGRAGSTTRTTRTSPRGRTRRKTRIPAARPNRTSKTNRNQWRSKRRPSLRRPPIFTRFGNMYSKCPTIGNNLNGARLNSRPVYSTARSRTRPNSTNNRCSNNCTARLASSSSSSSNSSSSSSRPCNRRTLLRD